MDFKEHPEYPRYIISKSGEVYDSFRRKYLNLFINTHGYHSCSINTGSGHKLKRVHRLVAETFLTDSEFYGLDVNHIDGNKTNNNLSNLEWCTRSHNIRHAINMKLNPSQGETHHNAVLTEETVKTICELLKSGYKNSEIMQMMGVNKDTVAHIKNGSLWKHISKDYKIHKITKKRLTKEEVEYIYKECLLRSKSESIASISRSIGFSPHTVERVWRKAVYKDIIDDFLNDYRKHSSFAIK